ncbi:tetratricopeptide repeat protein 41-like [Sycon ciliatum]|uniref:tetratricopeptide repeat protein 41-like n=1 Tax=Sycon ciliatum TaxID=27933 RepID=UPI0031F6A6D8
MDKFNLEHKPTIAPGSPRKKPAGHSSRPPPPLRRSLSVAKRQFSWREPIRPFVSSTFRDFQKERDVLVKRVFPKLEQLCRLRGTYFAPVDLRWGITEEQAGSGDIIRLCLDYVAKSRPYFLGLIGERYGSHQPPPPAAGEEPGDNASLVTLEAATTCTHGGAVETSSHGATNTPDLITLSTPSWPLNGVGGESGSADGGGGNSGTSNKHAGSHGPGPGADLSDNWIARNFRVAAKAGYPWLLDTQYRSYSITALEVELAAFRERFPYARFYFRNPQLADSTNLAHAMAESEFAAVSMQQLKQKIVESGLPVFQYNTYEELADAVMGEWRAIIDEVYPPLAAELSPAMTISKSNTVASDLFSEWAAHEAFAESRRRAFVATPELDTVLSALETHVAVNDGEGGDGKPSSPSANLLLESRAACIAILVGERGSGKSALLANWSKAISADEPDVHVVTHYVGSSSSSASPLGFMLHCIAELRSRFLDFDGNDRQQQNEDQLDLSRVKAAFGAALALGRSLIILDGLEEMSRETVGEGELDWLPSSLPTRSCMVVSTGENHSSFKALKRRPDTQVIRMPLLKNDDAKRQLVRCHLAVHCKQLSEDQLSRVVSSPLADKPFFLASLANEMRIFGEHEKVSERLSYYLAAKSPSHLWTLVIQRWVTDYGQDSIQSQIPHSQSTTDGSQAAKDGCKSSNVHAAATKPAGQLSGWVAAALQLLAVSRHGLSDSEVLVALQTCGYPQLTSLDWASFRSAAGDALFERQGGMLSFFHQHLRAAVFDCLLDVRHADVTDAADLQTHNPWMAKKAVWHRVLADYFQATKPSIRRTEELPWQRLMSSDMAGLQRAVCEPPIFLDCVDWQNNQGRLRLDLMTYWRALEKSGIDQLTSYRSMLETEKALLTRGGPKDSNADRQSTVQRYYALLASMVGRFLAAASKFTDAADVLRDAMEYAQEVHGCETDDAPCTTGDHQEFNSVRLLGPVELLSSVQEQLASLNLFQLHISEAERWFREALRTTGFSFVLDDADDDSLYGMDPKLVLRRGRLLDSLGFLKAKDAGPHAASMQQEAWSLLMKAKAYLDTANNTPSQADVLYHIAVCDSRLGRLKEAEEGMRGALRARKAWYGGEHPAIAEILNDLAGLLLNGKSESRLREAEQLYRQALDIRRKTVGPEHILTATTLYHLGKHLAARDACAQEEAVQLLRTSLSIRSSKLGESHVITKAVARRLGQLEDLMSSRRASANQCASGTDTQQPGRGRGRRGSWDHSTRQRGGSYDNRRRSAGDIAGGVSTANDHRGRSETRRRGHQHGGSASQDEYAATGGRGQSYPRRGRHHSSQRPVDNTPWQGDKPRGRGSRGASDERRLTRQSASAGASAWGSKPAQSSQGGDHYNDGGDGDGWEVAGRQRSRNARTAR